MDSFLKALDALKAAVPRFLDTFNVMASAIEHIALRLALLAAALYGIYRALISH